MRRRRRSARRSRWAGTAALGDERFRPRTAATGIGPGARRAARLGGGDGERGGAVEMVNGFPLDERRPGFAPSGTRRTTDPAPPDNTHRRDDAPPLNMAKQSSMATRGSAEDTDRVTESPGRLSPGPICTGDTTPAMPVARAGEPVALLVAGGRVERSGAVPGGEVPTVGEARTASPARPPLAHRRRPGVGRGAGRCRYS